MTPVLMLRLYSGTDFVEERVCLSAVLETEAYTPYVSIRAQFLSSGLDYGEITDAALYYRNGRVFIGMLDKLEHVRKDGAEIITVSARSYTWVLTQNQFSPGMHYNMTLEEIMEGVYQFPGVSCETYEGTGYIYVKEGASVWDSVVNFGYKLTGHYPYVQGNTVRVTLDAGETPAVIPTALILQTGEFRDNSRLVSHFHMADIEGNYGAYQLVNEDAVNAGIIRHKQFRMDQQYLHEPENALLFRKKFSMRACKGRWLTISGFVNRSVGRTVTCGDAFQNAVVSRMRMEFSPQGLRTTYWFYEDGFYGGTV